MSNYNGTSRPWYNNAAHSTWGFYDPGDTAWLLASSALMWIMIPGVGFYYSGFLQRKNALSLIMLSLLSLSVGWVQWYIFGYSLVYSKSGGSFIGNFENAFFRGVLADPSTGNSKVPDLVFALYQGMFAVLTPALIFGSGAERGRILPMIVFIFAWTTLVYDFIACWTWSPHGWSKRLGALDWAGGSPVHISSGAASLAYAIALKKRHRSNDRDENENYHNTSYIVLGTALIWFGWFGFNGGSNFTSTLRAAMACVTTNLAASFAALTWMTIDYFYTGHLSTISFCSGAISGLVAITPAAGFVGPFGAPLIGISAGIVCNFSCKLKFKVVNGAQVTRYDDVLDVFPVQAIGGFVGCILTGVFAESDITSLDNDPPIAGGWVNGNWIQVAYQLPGACAAMIWSFIITYLILIGLNCIPGLSIRARVEEEQEGIDISNLGELAYNASFP